MDVSIHPHANVNTEAGLMGKWHNKESYIPFFWIRIPIPDSPFFVAVVCSAVFLLLLGKDYFIIPTLIACLLSLMLLRRPIETGEVSDDE